MITLKDISWVWYASYSPNGKHIVTSMGNGALYIWDAVTAGFISGLNGHLDCANCAEYSPDGKNIVSGSSDNTVRIWDATTGECTSVLNGHKNSLCSVKYSLNGKNIVSASWDNTVRIWDVRTGQCKWILRGHTGAVAHASYSPDGKNILSASWDQTARVWDSVTGECVHVLCPAVVCAEYSPDGRNIVTTGVSEILVWDCETGKQVSSLKGTGTLLCVNYSPDGRYIVSSGTDNTVRVWECETRQCIWARTFSSTVRILNRTSIWFQKANDLHIENIPFFSVQTIWTGVLSVKGVGKLSDPRIYRNIMRFT